MKELKYLLIVMTLFASGIFVSCQAVIDVLEITLHDVVFEVPLDATEITTKVTSYPKFEGSATFNPTTNPELEPYLEAIRGVSITEIKIMVTSITPATGVSLIDASFKITDNVNSAEFIYLITETKALAVGTVFTIDNTTPNFNVVSDIINNLHAATISFEGHVNTAGFVIGFNNIITADITVGVPD